MAKKVFCYEIPLELGDHVIYLVLANGQKLADSYSKP